MKYYFYGFKRYLLVTGLMLCVVGITTGDVSAYHDKKKGYNFGVFPYLPASRLEAIYSPMTALFEKELGQPVRLSTRPTFAQFRHDVSQGKYDFIFIQPFDYVRAASSNGYIPLVRAKNDLRAVFVTGRDNTLSGINDLKGLNVVMPPQDAAVSLLGMIEIKLADLKSGRDVLVKNEKNHFSCMRQLLIKKADVCVTAPAPLKIFNTKSGNQLKVFAESRKVASSLYAVHNRVPESDAKKIRQLLLNLNKNPDIKNIITKTRLVNFKPAQDEDYDLVRSILIELGRE